MIRDNLILHLWKWIAVAASNCNARWIWSVLGLVSSDLSNPVFFYVVFGGRARAAFPNSNNNSLCCTCSCKLKHILRAPGHRAEKYFRFSFSRLTSFEKQRGQSLTETGNKRCSFSIFSFSKLRLCVFLFLGKGKDSWSKSTRKNGFDLRLLIQF